MNPRLPPLRIVQLERFNFVKSAAAKYKGKIMTPEEHIAYWKKCAAEASTKGAALTAFGVYAGLSMAEDEYKTVLRKLVFAARTSGGVAGRDEALCSACDAAEQLLLAKRT